MSPCRFVFINFLGAQKALSIWEVMSFHSRKFSQIVVLSIISPLHFLHSLFLELPLSDIELPGLVCTFLILKKSLPLFPSFCFTSCYSSSSLCFKPSFEVFFYTMIFLISKNSFSPLAATFKNIYNIQSRLGGLVG